MSESTPTIRLAFQHQRPDNQLAIIVGGRQISNYSIAQFYSRTPDQFLSRLVGAAGTALVAALFTHPEVKNVTLTRHALLIGKLSDRPWMTTRKSTANKRALVPEILALIAASLELPQSLSIQELPPQPAMSTWVFTNMERQPLVGFSPARAYLLVGSGHQFVDLREVFDGLSQTPLSD